jgi:hypothetical protein
MDIKDLYDKVSNLFSGDTPFDETEEEKKDAEFEKNIPELEKVFDQVAKEEAEESPQDKFMREELAKNPELRGKGLEMVGREKVQSTPQANQSIDLPPMDIESNIKAPEKEQPLNLKERYIKALEDYKSISDKKVERPHWSNALEDTFARLYNLGGILNPTGVPQMKIPGSMRAAQNKLRQDKQDKIRSLDNTRKMLAELMALEAKSQPEQMTPYQKRMVELRDKELNIKEKESGLKKKDTPFQKKKMEEYAKKATDFYTKDRTEMLSNVPRIDDTIKLLEDNPDLTGTLPKRITDAGMSLRDREAVDAKENIDAAIAATLRPTLGAQFTAQEKEEIQNLQFSYSASVEENKKRAKRLREKIIKKVKFEEDLYRYIEKNGTDEGFPYGKYGMQVMTSSSAPLNSGQVERRTKDGRIAIFDAKTKKFIRYKE